MCSCYGDSNEHSKILYSHVQIYSSVELEWSQEVSLRISKNTEVECLSCNTLLFPISIHLLGLPNNHFLTNCNQCHNQLVQLL